MPPSAPGIPICDNQGSESFTTDFAEKFIYAGHGQRIGSYVAIPPAGYEPFRVAGRGMIIGSHMSVSNAETFLRNATQQVSQSDINASLLRAIAELTRDVKRLEDDVRRVRRDAQMSRRF